MKKALILLAIIFILPLIVITPVFAQEFSQGNQVTLPKSQTIDGDYFVSGRQVTIDGIVTGDSYVAGGVVLVNGEVDGDLLVAGGDVNIQGHIEHDLRVIGGNVIISGMVDGNVTVVGGTVQIEKDARLSGSLTSASGTINVLSPVKNGATIAGGTVTVANSIGGNLVATIGQLDLTSTASINGDLKYWSKNAASIDDSARITGNTFHYATPTSMTPNAGDFIGRATALSLPLKIISFLASLLIGLLLIYFLPRYSAIASDQALNNFWKSILVGFLAVILVPFLFIILCVTVIGLPLAFILLALFFLEIYLSHIVISFAVGQKFFELTGTPVRPWQSFALGLLAYSVITLLPFLGGLIWLLAGFTGFGAIILTKRSFFREFSGKKLL